jgi:hypothetical protein
MTNSSNDVIKCYNSKIFEYKSERSKICLIDSVVKYVLEQKSIGDAINTAVMSKDKNEKKHSHQRRLQNNCLEDYAQKLLEIKNQISQVKSFNSLYILLEQNRIHGVGELLIYDVSVRIGEYLKIYPETIYIHAGTKTGLQNLLKRKIPEKQIKKEMLPEPFCSSDLTPGQLEDFFCIYKDIFINCINGDITNCKIPSSIKKRSGCN